jgi:hypothetical protein
MNPERKPRPDSPLRMLPEERQAAIMEMLEDKSYAQVRKSLAKDGLVVSENALSKFRSWWLLREQFKEMSDTTDTLVELKKQEQPDLTPEELFNYGQQVFGTLAVKSQNVKHWKLVQGLRQKESDLRFQQEKFREAIKGDIERALDALYEEIKGNKTALELFQKFKAAVKGATK